MCSVAENNHMDNPKLTGKNNIFINGLWSESFYINSESVKINVCKNSRLVLLKFITNNTFKLGKKSLQMLIKKVSFKFWTIK